LGDFFVPDPGASCFSLLGGESITVGFKVLLRRWFWRNFETLCDDFSVAGAPFTVSGRWLIPVLLYVFPFNY